LIDEENYKRKRQAEEILSNPCKALNVDDRCRTRTRRVPA